MSLHPHQLEILRIELAREEYAELDAEAAYELATSKAALYRMGSVICCAPEKAARLRAPKRPPAGPIMEVAPELFPTGIPGFPNKLRREWFDAAWKEVTHGTA